MPLSKRGENRKAQLRDAARIRANGAVGGGIACGVVGVLSGWVPCEVDEGERCRVRWIRGKIKKLPIDAKL